MKRLMRNSKLTDIERSATEQAAEWLAILSDEACSNQERLEFAHWLVRSNRNIDEFLRLSTLTRQLQSGNSWPEVDIDALIAEAREESKVIDGAASHDRRFWVGPNRVARDKPGSKQHTENRRHTTGLAIVAAALGLSIVAGALFFTRLGSHAEEQIFSTRLGELRSVTLADGSTAQLNSLSRVSAKFTAHERLVRLIAGEAIFKVKKNPTKPFRVETLNANVVALGTQFDVNSRLNRTIVTLFEGRVAISLPPSAARVAAGTPYDGKGSAVPNRLLDHAGSHDGTRQQQLSESQSGVASAILNSPGEQAIVQPQHVIAKIDRVDVGKVTAWTVRRIYFDNTPLSAAVQEFANYSAQIIRIEDPTLGDRQISGTFDTSDPGSLVRFLEHYGDVRAQPTGSGWTLSRQMSN